MEPWEQETSRYTERLAHVAEWRPDLSNLIERLPDIPLSYDPSPHGNVAILLSMFVLGCTNFANQAVAAFLKLWGNGLFATISLPARLTYELWGATHHARHTIEEMHNSGEVHIRL